VTTLLYRKPAVWNVPVSDDVDSRNRIVSTLRGPRSVQRTNLSYPLPPASCGTHRDTECVLFEGSFCLNSINSTIGTGYLCSEYCVQRYGCLYRYRYQHKQVGLSKKTFIFSPANCKYSLYALKYRFRYMSYYRYADGTNDLFKAAQEMRHNLLNLLTVLLSRD